MAEIRKHKQTNSAIAQAIEAAMGASVRPVAPGAPPEPTHRPSATDAQATSFASFPTAGTATGWASVDPYRMLDAQRRARSAAEREATDEADAD